jgi:hypothetical protein
MNSNEMYNMFLAAANLLPETTQSAPSKINAGLRPAPAREDGLNQLREISAQCQKGNYASNRPLSYSSLKHFAKHPLCYLEYCKQPKSEPTSAQVIGLLFESLLVAGQLPEGIISAENRPDPSATFAAKANKEWKAAKEAAGLTIASLEQIETARAMAADVLKNSPFLSGKGGAPKYQAQHNITLCGLDLVCITDLEFPDCVVEIKTTNTISGFRNQFFKECYWLQAALQHVATQKPVYFLVVQSEAPFIHEVIHITEGQMAEYKRRLRALLLNFRTCLRHGFRHDEKLLSIEPTYEFKNVEQWYF